MNEFQRCLQEGRLVRIEPSPALVSKELGSAEYDLHRAEESLGKGDFKWASVQAYYAMFHAAKALVLSKGYREKGHYCLIVALRELFVGPGELDASIGDDLELCMDIRHEADYSLVFSGENAALAVRSARRTAEVALDALRDALPP
ncbi:MAG: HEPN domain-containing protein [Candidatus Undinarchaeales archaeon]|nr:HEPN domain-containing protein [Candidatus Undinarchaeales archaeon]